MLQWLRRRFLTGFFVTVPLVISLATVVWIFTVVDGFTAPLFTKWLGREIPGLGILTTALGVLLIGVISTNVIGKRILQRGESYLLRVPVFRTIYAPVKQLVVAFSPDNEHGFKRMVMIEQPGRGWMLGFLTKEFTVAGAVAEVMLAVYVPTNHLYLGDVFVVARDHAVYPDLTVEQGIRIFLTGGMALPARVHGRRGDDPEGDVRV